MKLVLVISVFAACQRTAPLPGTRRDMTAIVGGAIRMAIADLDGDGHPELTLVDAEAMRVVDAAGHEIARAEVSAGIEVLSAADLDGDHRAEVLAGWGLSPDHRSARSRVTLHRLDGARLVDELVVAPPSTRQDVAAVIARGPELLIAYFDSTYSVTKVTARHTAGGWSTGDPVVLRMATSWAIGDLDGDTHPDVVVGRLYGDAKDQDGDAFVLSPDGQRRAIPTLRGVQGLAVADTDGDGRDEIFLGDGWHQDYGQIAHGRLTWARLVDRELRSEVIEDTPGQYTIWQILVADVDGDGKPELVTRGSRYVRVYRRSGDRWHGLTIAGAARDLAVGDLDGTGTAILIAGEHSELISLRGVTW
jgi:FG-GAP-like repeat